MYHIDNEVDFVCLIDSEVIFVYHIDCIVAFVYHIDSEVVLYIILTVRLLPKPYILFIQLNALVIG